MYSEGMIAMSLEANKALVRQFVAAASWIDRVVEGRIVERRGVIDMLGVLQQLGIVPT
jgi:hypothetical protein